MVDDVVSMQQAVTLVAEDRRLQPSRPFTNASEYDLQHRTEEALNGLKLRKLLLEEAQRAAGSSRRSPAVH
jgi:hypothetical protein